jgi:hypothetical protein
MLIKLDSKSNLLNLNAQEYKPKSLTQPAQNTQNMGQNPYVYYNMNNPYGGMNNQNMGNVGIIQWNLIQI